MQRHYYPALRGRVGNWAYYSILMTMEQLANRVKFAEEIHKIRGSKKLSGLIQRELEERGPEIAAYLNKNEDRFFNSIVVAVYEGSPAWHEFDITSNSIINKDSLDVTAKYSTGYLSLNNSEKLFALDGQHRLSGIRLAVKKNPGLGSEELPVIMISHRNTKSGLKRTRKLFTTLNKTARPVNKSQIIALDESDVSAIVTRHLVEEDEYWSKNDLVDIYGKTANLPISDTKHVTNIINLYDVLDILFKSKKFDGSPKKLRQYKLNRPKNKALNRFIKISEIHFSELRDAFPEFGYCFSTKNISSTLKKHRHNKGGHILYRPVGLKIVTDVLCKLHMIMGHKKAIQEISKIPTDIANEPYLNILWRTNGTMRVGGAALTRDLLLYMLGHCKQSNEKKLLTRYAKVLEKNVKNVSLPSQI